MLLISEMFFNYNAHTEINSQHLQDSVATLLINFVTQLYYGILYTLVPMQLAYLCWYKSIHSIATWDNVHTCFYYQLAYCSYKHLDRSWRCSTYTICWVTGKDVCLVTQFGVEIIYGINQLCGGLKLRLSNLLEWNISCVNVWVLILWVVFNFLNHATKLLQVCSYFVTLLFSFSLLITMASKNLYKLQGIWSFESRCS